MSYAASAVVYHAHPLRFRSFWRQHFNYGRAALSYRQARVKRGQGGLRLEPWQFYAELVRYPFARPRGSRRFVLAGLLGISQVANASGFWWAAAVQRPGRVPVSQPQKELV
jgi:hypothetical protein